MDTWATVAQAAWNIKDEKQAWEAIDHGIADATALYNLDTDEDSPNVAFGRHLGNINARTGATAAEFWRHRAIVTVTDTYFLVER